MKNYKKQNKVNLSTMTMVTWMLKFIRQLIIILLFYVFPVFGQESQCYCDKDTLMNGATASCDTTTFDNSSKIYWQYNCYKIWLTLENINNEKFVIDEMPVELYNLTYRLGFNLIKEFKNSLLFRSGCSASGPCNYLLIDKLNGKKIKEFYQLICIDTDVLWENPHKYEFDFVVYLSYNTEQIIIYFIDSGQTINKTFKEKLNALIPEYNFNKLTVENNLLTIFYNDNDRKMQKIEIDLNETKNNH